MVVDQADQLVDEERLPGAAFVARRRLFLQPPRYFGPAIVQRTAKQGHDFRPCLGAAARDEFRNCGTDCPPVDDRALVGDPYLIHKFNNFPVASRV